MIHNFDKSEAYRKYVIGLHLEEGELYTVWGTDMLAGEQDKLLVENGRLIVFQSLSSLEMYLKNGNNPFLDKQNFEKWIIEENLNRVYNTNDLRLLNNFIVTSLENKGAAVSILNSLNLIEDFFIQINEKDIYEYYENYCIVELKDFIYNNYFWKHRWRKSSYNKFDNGLLEKILKNIYCSFRSKMEAI